MNTELTQEEYEILDKIVNVAFVNLFTISKNDNTIYFSEFDLNNDKHWALLNIARTYSDIILPCIICLEMPLIPFLKLRFKLKFKKIRRSLQREPIMSCDHFIENIEKANKDIITDPFLKLTEYYYPRKDKS